MKGTGFAASHPKIEEENLVITVSIIPENEINRDKITFARLRYNPQTKNYFFHTNDLSIIYCSCS